MLPVLLLPLLLPLLTVFADASRVLSPLFGVAESSLLPGVFSETRGMLDTWRSLSKSCSPGAIVAPPAACRRCRLKGNEESIDGKGFFEDVGVLVVAAVVVVVDVV